MAARSELTKIKVFNFCDQAKEEFGDDFSLAQVEIFSGGTNKQTLIKYVDQYRKIQPLANLLPGCDWKVLEAIQMMDKANQELLDSVREPLLKQVSERDQYIFELEAKLENMANNVESMDQDLNSKLQHIKDLESNISDLEKQKEQLSAYHNADNELKEAGYKNQISVMEEKLNHAIKKNDDLDTALKSLAERYDELQEHTTKTERELLAKEKALLEASGSSAPPTLDQYLENFTSNPAFDSVIQEYAQLKSNYSIGLQQLIHQYEAHYFH